MKKIWELILCSGVLGSYCFTVHTFYYIFRYGSLTWSEPNKIILYSEILFLILVAVLIFYKASEIIKIKFMEDKK